MPTQAFSVINITAKLDSFGKRIGLLQHLRNLPCHQPGAFF